MKGDNPVFGSKIDGLDLLGLQGDYIGWVYEGQYNDSIIHALYFSNCKKKHFKQ